MNWVTPSEVTEFQSTHLHEVWLFQFLQQVLFHVFQSTHLHEVWQDWSWRITLSFCFNPHTYMRCDLWLGGDHQNTSSFNPHTYMRCDSQFSVWRCCCCVSIHTPTWGVTKYLDSSQSLQLFQSTHLHEVWPLKSEKKTQNQMFQSTHLHEVWHLHA